MTLAHTLWLGPHGLSAEGLVASGWPGAGAPPKTGVQQALGLPTGRGAGYSPRDSALTRTLTGTAWPEQGPTPRPKPTLPA